MAARKILSHIKYGGYPKEGPLMDAASAGNLPAIKRAIADGVSIDMWDCGMLRAAARNGKLKVVEWLLAQGASLGAPSFYCLRQAAGGGHIEVVKALLAQGADIHAERDSPLATAAKTGQTEMVRFLLSQGADAKANHHEPLCVALNENQMGSVEAMLAHLFAPEQWAQKSFEDLEQTTQRMIRNIKDYRCLDYLGMAELPIDTERVADITERILNLSHTIVQGRFAASAKAWNSRVKPAAPSTQPKPL